MSKYRIENTYYCAICGEKYNKDLDAIDCYDSHYRIEKIIGTYYEKGKKCPIKVQCEISLGIGGDKKDVFFTVVDNGWGSK
jgi:hypothetical protein